MAEIGVEKPEKCPCGTQNQSPTAFFHSVHVGCPDAKDELDPWHYTGIKGFHVNSNVPKFLEECKRKLPNRELPIWVGFTGYVNAKKSIFSEHDGWCLDKLGRVVVLLNGALMFQRYLEGDLIMKSHDGNMFDSMGNDDLNTYSKMLQNDHPLGHPIM